MLSFQFTKCRLQDFRVCQINQDFSSPRVFKAAATDDGPKGADPGILLSSCNQCIDIRTTLAEHGEHRRPCLEQQNAWYLAKRSYSSRLNNNIRKKSRQAIHSPDLETVPGGNLQERLRISYGSRFKAAAIADSLNNLNPVFYYLLVIDVLISEALERGMGSTVDRVQSIGTPDTLPNDHIEVDLKPVPVVIHLRTWTWQCSFCFKSVNSCHKHSRGTWGASYTVWRATEHPIPS